MSSKTKLKNNELAIQINSLQNSLKEATDQTNAHIAALSTQLAEIKEAQFKAQIKNDARLDRLEKPESVKPLVRLDEKLEDLPKLVTTIMNFESPTTKVFVITPDFKHIYLKDLEVKKCLKLLKDVKYFTLQHGIKIRIPFQSPNGTLISWLGLIT